MASDRAFLVPVVIDDTPDSDDRVPDRFRELQWMRLPDGETPPEFVQHILKLLSWPESIRPTPSSAAVIASSERSEATHSVPATPAAKRSTLPRLAGLGAGVLIVGTAIA